ncbi:Uncharacterised protein [Amycolatopsis camponoti]|uniref:Uncharacterized protein n=1 Tax=Amycolatopsis camponoti TaxID=2606593 RepID=A0A6I8LPF9_9PSEU|nr:Uncharacterised protein [Amycolatopsis camponoti]
MYGSPSPRNAETHEREVDLLWLLYASVRSTSGSAGRT